MLKYRYGLFGFFLMVVIAVSLTVPTYAGDEVFVVSSSLNGDANFLPGYGDGNFFSQEILRETRNTDIDVPFKFSYGNGLGDFDNDGDLDYITAIGFGSGKIYIYEKMGPGNQFADPVVVDTWGTVEGRFAKDFAVADYNEDGSVDFVLSLGRSVACGLYLGDGQFGFESRLLPESAARDSAGADAADFNNDEHADFVVAPGDSGPFYVSLGDGNGNFSTYPFESADGGPVYGIAAADFTGDGNADIVAAYTDYLYVYEGAGDGRTFTHRYSYELPFNAWSAIDNYDVDRNGSQDLVVANYDGDTAGVAVLLGNGDGSFTYSDTYLGGTVQERNALTGPPYEPISNLEPVAVIDPEYLKVTAGEEIIFDGSKSFDDDGQIVSYEWEFGDMDTDRVADPASGTRQADAGRRVKGVKSPHTYLNKGTYLVTLWVADDQGATSSVQAEVQVKPVEVQVAFYPSKLYFGRKAKSLWAKIVFQGGFDARNVDESSVCIVPEGASAIFAHQKKHNSFLYRIFNKFRKRRKSIIVRFDRQAVLANLACPPAGRTELKIQGEIFHNDRWVEFEGTGAVRTAMKRSRRVASGCGPN